MGFTLINTPLIVIVNLDLGAIYRTEVCTEVCVGAIYLNKVVSEPGYDKQWQKTEPFAKAKPTDIRRKTSREYTNYLLSVEDRYRGRGYDRGQEAEQKHVKIMEDMRDKVHAEYHVLKLQPEGPLSESVFEACSL
ncbi:hypothetical protein Tco_1225511 [Tanacetum coccineum]